MKRRSFIKTGVAAGAVTATFGGMFGALGAKVYANGPTLARLAYASGTGRVLVIVQLDGGNDGLNTVIPFQDIAYHNARRGLAISSPLRITDTLGWHPAMTGFERLFNDGRIAIVQNVGYANPNRSHFRATDIFFTGSNNTTPADQNTFLEDGWVGRYLEHRFPNYPDVAPAHPMALQIGSTTGLLLQGSTYNMGMAVYDPVSFYTIINQTDISGSEQPDLSTPAGMELDYIQRTAMEAQAYAAPVRDTFNSTNGNRVTYPANGVSDQLKIVARLIAGGLETPIYIISQRGYDTHSNQAPSHQRLLGDLSGAITAFFDDLAAFGVADRVALATVSEFGRRVQANEGSRPGEEGTDHGTCAPMFFVGPEVHGGVYGHDPDLVNLVRGDLVHEFDFKQTYASILRQWFGVNQSDAALLLHGEFETLPLFVQGPVSASSVRSAASFSLGQNYPNPVSASSGTQVLIPFSISGGRTRLTLYDLRGRMVTTILDADMAPGRHEAAFTPRGLSTGTYVYRLESRGYVESRTLTLVR